jgi:hypothetical protein
MAGIQVQGNAGVVTEVDSTHRTIRQSGRPMELGARGAYTLGVVSGIMAAGLAANSEIVQMRWTDATRVLLLRSVMLSAGPGTTAFAAGPIEFNMTFARSWSADGTGGNAQVFSTNNTNKKRTDFPLSLFTDTGFRVASTAALGAGTKTLDTNKLSSLSSYVSSVATTAASSPFIIPGTYLWQRNTHDEYPILFEQNEGIVIRATVPATGTWQFSVIIEWAEIDPSAVTGW